MKVNLPLIALFGVLFAHMPLLHAQKLLTADEAVKLALAANHDIQLAQGDATIAQLNNTKGNAGMLPNVNLVVNENFTLSAFQQKLANGTEFVAAGAPFNNANAGVQLAWTLFDGRRMYIAKNRLEETETLGQINLQQAIQNTAANVLLAYYDIVRSKLQERALAEVIVLTEERLRIAEARLAAGYAAQTDALQARIDLNQRKADLLLQQNLTAAAKRTLNQLLVRNSETAFDVPETLETNYRPDRDQLLQKMAAQNPTLLSFQKSAAIAALLVDETRTLGKARINGIAQFNALRADNGAGFALNNTQAGITLGASLVLPLYTGGNVRRQVETSKIVAMQAQTRVENQREIMDVALQNQLANLQVQQQILGMEEANVGIARENLTVSTERFRVGTTNGLEPQTAQNSLEQALLRRNLVLYNLKIAEMQLKLLAGEL
jgi:outer membrane protein TolC